MTSASSPTDLRIATVCTLVLYLKMIVALGVQGTVKFKSGARAPEDLAHAQAKSEEPVAATDPEELRKAKEREHRWNRIVGNDMENIPLGIILAWVSIMAGGNTSATSVLFILFTVCRVVHTVAFANGVFLPRTLAWQIGVLSTLCLAVTAVIGAF
ncbi:unnamed protein product [Aphanomyces euteiches]|uniref:Microsomal glutathione S-transferase 1 n=1 Tax=Aphanomyces euteiches TaxID=100861 RepID=A0A6G0WM43_9STRA|nr:hypothetical protein Ae201684_013774 [Aphanomyces euteiches]KAH9080930.1 hypothetical protein Ae201684P_008016 [Aphanomyces euteiches]KAH9145471.1 hypothetical protein AeRB84_010602 [Aphanomyces euteiches]